MVLLESLIEKKNMYIYVDQRISRLWVASKNIGARLRDPEVSNKQKKALMRGQQKLRGRYKELKHLKAVLAEGRLKSEAKRMWLQNFDDGLIEKVQSSSGSAK